MMRQSTLDMEDLRKRRSLVITRKEAAEALGVDPRTITTSINEGTIPSVRLGRRVVIPREKFLALFADEMLGDYERYRDLPALDGTSRLSPYLAAGVLSPRQCLHAALRGNRGEFETGNPGAVAWINELLWREFYKHVLVGYPRVSRHRAFRVQTEALGWRDAPEELLAWQQGRKVRSTVTQATVERRTEDWKANGLYIGVW